MSRDFADFAEMAAQARANYARTIEAARQPDATCEQIVDALDAIVCRRLALRSLELAQMGLSRAEHRAAVLAYGAELDKQQAADLAVLLE